MIMRDAPIMVGVFFFTFRFFFFPSVLLLGFLLASAEVFLVFVCFLPSRDLATEGRVF